MHKQILLTLKDPGLLPKEMAGFSIFCKEVQAFWLQLPELQGASKIGLFQPEFVLNLIQIFFCIDFLG